MLAADGSEHVTLHLFNNAIDPSQALQTMAKLRFVMVVVLHLLLLTASTILDDGILLLLLCCLLFWTVLQHELSHHHLHHLLLVPQSMVFDDHLDELLFRAAPSFCSLF